jgi:hypothetical protein
MAFLESATWFPDVPLPILYCGTQRLCSDFLLPQDPDDLLFRDRTGFMSIPPK